MFDGFEGGTRIQFLEGESLAVHEASHAIARFVDRAKLNVSVPDLLVLLDRV